MAARGQGVIVNIIGAGGKVASPIHLAGGSANAALMLATAGLGNAYAASGVRVVGVSPGLTETGRVAEGMAADASHAGITVEAAIERSVQKIPMGRMAKRRRSPTWCCSSPQTKPAISLASPSLWTVRSIQWSSSQRMLGRPSRRWFIWSGLSGRRSAASEQGSAHLPP